MEDKRRKSYEAFLNFFYPPRANQSQRQQEEERAVLNPTLIGAVSHGLSDISEVEEEVEEEGKNSSSESASECTVRNLTRSQRKRIRRQKLKQAASSRRRIIGPMLPSTEEIAEFSLTPIPLLEERSLTETITHDANVAEVVGARNQDYGGPPRNVESNKLKQRRLAKKLRRSTNICSVEELEIPPPDMSPAQQLGKII